MKTETLIKVIIFGIFFCLVILTFSANIPSFYKYLPPISSEGKHMVTKKRLLEFLVEFKKAKISIADNKNEIFDKILNNKKDPWGSQYWFKVVKWDIDNYSIRVLFGSSGPDKKPNTKDDLTRLYTF